MDLTAALVKQHARAWGADLVGVAPISRFAGAPIMHAYANRRHHGNLLDLFEPGFAPAFAPWILDNDRFPADWFERTVACTRDCHLCDYCRQVLERVLVRAESD